MGVAPRRVSGAVADPRCASVRARWGVGGEPIEAVADELGVKCSDLPGCVWEAQEAGMEDYVDDE